MDQSNHIQLFCISIKEISIFTIMDEQRLLEDTKARA